MDMNRKPFQFGVPVAGEYFIGRECEQKRLAENLRHGINTILMSPRRWGKTSLVNKVAKDVAAPDLIVIRMDAFSCRSEYDFYNLFSAEILRQTTSRIEEWKELAKGFIERLTPKVSISSDAGLEISFSLGITPKTHTPEEILDLPEMIAQRKGCRIVVCIDEFQQIGEFKDSLTVQKRMRSVWQHQENVSYCFYGSKMHMMTAFFQKKSYPFYKFGDIVYLKAIPTDVWIPYIGERFVEAGKYITDDHIALICDMVEHNSSYVQQLSWLVMLNTEEYVDEGIISQSVNDLIDQNTISFIQQTQSLTSYQVNFLQAVLDGIHDGYTRADVLAEYNLGTAGNVARLKASLIEKELIEVTEGGVRIGDPVLRMWLRKNFMKLR